jgi:hypothetical protein
MKKLLLTLIVTLSITSCMKDDDILTPIDDVVVPESLVIDDLVGIKLESVIVSDEVRMNIKLPYTGEYRVKIRDISKNLISQEKVNGKEGDNLLKVYVNTLENDGYTIELHNNVNEMLGITSFVVQ